MDIKKFIKDHETTIITTGLIVITGALTYFASQRAFMSVFTRTTIKVELHYDDVAALVENI